MSSIASTTVLLSVAAVLRADRVARTHQAVWALAFAAGCAAGAAMTVKQSFGDGVVFGVVLLGLRMRRGGPAGRSGAALIGFAAGIPRSWSWSPRGRRRRGALGDLAYAAGGFRFDASEVLASWSASARMHRLAGLAALALVSGLGLLLAAAAVSSWRLLRRPSPAAIAIVAAASVELLGAAAGGVYWSHYLLGLVPMAVLAAGAVAASRSAGPVCWWWPPHW